MDLLAVDVGAGTQDVLLYQEGSPLENSVKMVMPSQTVIVASRIESARREGKDVFLKGPTMGGGASVSAVRRHLEAGLKVYATPSAALTINDDLDKVRGWGIKISEEDPAGAVVIQTGDLDLPALREAFRLFEVPMPENLAVAVQDHGYSPDRSNRIVRFEQMAEVIRSGGRPESFASFDPPALFSRMRAVKDGLEQEGFRPLIMDTGPAALLGATLDPHYREPALVLNLGNGHTIGAVMMDGRITALFEHHTSAMTPERLLAFSKGLSDGTLTNAQVFEDGGHGAHVEEAPGARSIGSVMVTGPNRGLILGSDAFRPFGEITPAAPGGDMMTSGCLGLIEASKRLR